MPPAAGTTPSRAALPAAGNVAETLLAVVSEKTGYPAEMLDLDMGLDSDLGIDSIKRVEILSALQERLPGSPVIGPEHLGTLRTLGEIARHLAGGAGQVPPQAEPPPSSRPHRRAWHRLPMLRPSAGAPWSPVPLG